MFQFKPSSVTFRLNTPLSAPPCHLAESPLWFPSTESLYWLDIGVPSTLFRWEIRTAATRSWRLPELATAIVASTNDELMVVAQSGVHRFDPRSGALHLVAPVNFPMQGMRFNDGGCDANGRLWVGTMPNDFAGEASQPIGSIWCLDSDLTFQRILEGFGCPNTFAWSADNTTMYLADSARGSVSAYRYDIAAGTLTDPRLFAAPSQLGVPDGSAMDVEGCLWNARWGAGCVARFAPDGTLLQTVSLPTSNVSSCAFGGPDLQTLFVTTASVGLTEREREQQPLAGRVFSVTPGVTGMPPHRFDHVP